MATATTTLASCVLNFMYSAASALLTMIKNILLALIEFIDAKIAELRAIIAMLDVLKNLNDAVWAITKAIIDQIKNTLLGGIQDIGPAAEICPEFYYYFTDPIIALIDSFSVAEVQKERASQAASVVAAFDILLVYWESTKATLIEAITVIDDALYVAKEREDAAIADALTEALVP